jgi:hypothetical protein
MLGWILRYRPVIEILDQARAGLVLDLGSGWSGLSWTWPHEVIETDLFFVGERPQDHVGKPIYVAATAEFLPFRDHAFDFAVSVDMMEHLPQDIRRPVVAEMARVSTRAIIVSYPSGHGAAFADRLTSRVYRVLGKSPPPWLAEHVAQDRYPDRSTFVAALPAAWKLTRELRLTNAFVGIAQAWVEILLPSLKLWVRLENRYRGRSLPLVLGLPPTLRRMFVAAPSSSAEPGSTSQVSSLDGT